MTNLRQVESIQKELIAQVEDDSRNRKLKTLDYLLNPRNYTRDEKLESVISIPKYEIDEEYLAELLKLLGYLSPKYDEGYDGYYEGTVFKITL